MSLSYIKRAEQGNRSALAFIATIFISIGILFLGQLFAGLMIVLAVFLSGKDIGSPDLKNAEYLLHVLPFPLTFSLLMFSFVLLIICLWICLRLFHQRKLSSLWSDEDRFRGKEFFAGLMISIVLFVAWDIVTHFIFPSDHKWVFNANKFFVFLPLALIFIPLQTLAEELFFRGYLYQAFGMVAKNPWAPWIICGIIFGGFHFGNVEMNMSFWKMGIVYIGSGLMIGLSVVLSRGIEFGWGFHLVNNLYLSIITNFPGSSLDGPTLYSIPKPSADRVLLEFCIMFVIFTTILLIRYRKNVKNLLKPVP